MTQSMFGSMTLRRKRLFFSRAAFALTLLGLAGIAPGAYAREPGVPQGDPGLVRLLDMPTISNWLVVRFYGANRQAFRVEDMHVEAHACGCEDQPVPHFPYRVVLVSTPMGDLVARPEGQEGAVGIAPLAVRYGDRYCDAQTDERCYGAFAHPCEFTDFRYGPSLAEYFPTCKTDTPKGSEKPDKED